MEIINNRYKIEELINDDASGVVYKGIDLYNSNKKVFLKLLRNNNTPIINYFINNFIHIKSVYNQMILASESFGKIKSIDNKPINQLKYFYTSEYFDGILLKDLKENININDIICITLQLCYACEYLLFRGVDYKYLTPDNIYILKNDKEINVKIKDLATIKEYELNDSYGVFSKNISFPEIVHKNRRNNEKNYIYDIGKILYYLLTGEKHINYNEIEKLTKLLKSRDIDDSLINILKGIINKNTKIGYRRIHKIIKDLKGIVNCDCSFVDNSHRERLNLNTKIIGRENEINIINNIDNSYNEGKKSKTYVLIEGKEGLGKTRLLDEIFFRMNMRDRNVYKVKVLEEEESNFKPIKNLLRSIIKNNNGKNLDKYGTELVKILPELKELYDFVPSSSLSGKKEKLRLYDRISKFISEGINKVTYLFLDDLHNADDDTLNLIDYMINIIKECPIVIIATYNKNSLNKKPNTEKYFEIWQKSKEIEKIKLIKFNFEETAIAIKNILGIGFSPINFATRIYKHTFGNPRYIEEVLKNLMVKKEIFVNKEGVWDYKSESYSKMNIPSNIDEAIDNQLDSLNRESFEAVKMMSIFNTSVSGDIIIQMLNHITKDKLETIFNKLVSMKILERKFEDWGYTYDFYNLQTKSFIYHRILDNDKIKLHFKAANILEKQYKEENRYNIEELIYHLRMSKQYKKAIDFAIEFANRMKDFMINRQSISLWEMAKDMLQETDYKEKGIEIYLNLGKLYNEKGLKNKSIEYFNKALDITSDIDFLEKTIDIKNLISDTYNRLTEYDKAMKLAIESRNLAKEIDYVDGLLESVTIINKINFSRGKNKAILSLSFNYLEMAKKHHKYESVASLYNQLGIINMLNGNLKDAEKYYKESIIYFEKSKMHIEATKPINNLGLIYGEYYGNIDKAMEYLEKGLQIAEKYNTLYNKAFFLVNIGSMHIRKNNYDKAKEYTLKMLDIALNIEEKNMVESANINLGNIYLDVGEFDKAWVYFQQLKSQYENGKINLEDIDKYLEFAARFYYFTSQWNNSINVCNVILKKNSTNKNNYYMNALSIKKLIKYYLGSYENIDIIGLVDQHKKNGLIWDVRYYLLEFGLIALLRKDFELLDKILKKDCELVKIFSTDYLNLIRNFLEASIGNEVNTLIKLKKKAKKLKAYKVELVISRILGDEYFKKNYYFLSANYYLEFMEIIYKISERLPNKQMKDTFAKNYGVFYIRRRLSGIKNIIFSNKDNGTEKIVINENYFDFSDLEELFYNEKFLNTVSKQYDNTILEGILNIDDLINKLDLDYKKNLSMILSYAMREILAERGIISIYDEEKEDFVELISQNVSKEKHLQMLIDKLIQKQRNGYIRKSMYEQYNKSLDFYIPEDIKSFIFLPITKKVDKDINLNINNKIIGYIYLDTNKILNIFNEKNYLKIKKLVQLILLNIDNYNLTVLSSIDKLTNVYTRKYMDIAYNNIFNECRKENKSFSIIMADIDKFKEVNDTYGHQKGDEILKEVGEVLINNSDDLDIVARYGGEEFIIILPFTDKDQAYKKGEKIRRTIEEKLSIGKNDKLTISLGVSQYPYHGQFKEEIIEKADQALYNAKQTGRNKSVIWEKSLIKSNKRIDKLAGIVTGNTVKDHRMVLAMIEIMGLIKEDLPKIEKYHRFLGRLIEIIEAKQGSLIILNKNLTIKNVYTRERFKEDWIDDHYINEKFINRVIENGMGEYLIDWDHIEGIDSTTGNPDWQSMVIVPLIYSGKIKGIVQISVPIKEKEFDYNSYNFINVISSILAALV